MPGMKWAFTKTFTVKWMNKLMTAVENSHFYIKWLFKEPTGKGPLEPLLSEQRAPISPKSGLPQQPPARTAQLPPVLVCGPCQISHRHCCCSFFLAQPPRQSKSEPLAGPSVTPGSETGNGPAPLSRSIAPTPVKTREPGILRLWVATAWLQSILNYQFE